MRTETFPPNIHTVSSSIALLPFIKLPKEPDLSAAAETKSQDDEVQKLMTQLKDWSPDLRATGLAGLIDPHLVSPSRWARRHGDLFRAPGADELEEQMRESGGNVVPILVRPCSTSAMHPEFPEARFEVLSGLKRLMVALRLGINVFAVVVEMTDQEAARVIVQSNRAAVAPRPYEFGRTCYQLLADGVFPRQNALAAALGVQTSEVCNSLILFKLDPLIIGAFRTPLELQFGDGRVLKRAWEEDPEGMSRRASKATLLRGKLKRLEVLALLLTDPEAAASESKVPKSDVSVVVEGVLVAVISTTTKGLTTIKLKRKSLPAAGIETLRTALEKLGSSAEGILLLPS